MGHVYRTIPSLTLVFDFVALRSSRRGDIASSTINQLSDLELADAITAWSELVRASHFVQLFNYQDRQNSAGSSGPRKI